MLCAVSLQLEASHCKSAQGQHTLLEFVPKSIHLRARVASPYRLTWIMFNYDGPVRIVGQSCIKSNPLSMNSRNGWACFTVSDMNNVPRITISVPLWEIPRSVSNPAPKPSWQESRLNNMIRSITVVTPKIKVEISQGQATVLVADEASFCHWECFCICTLLKSFKSNPAWSSSSCSTSVLSVAFEAKGKRRAIHLCRVNDGNMFLVWTMNLGGGKRK